jgi:hypothetical protein
VNAGIFDAGNAGLHLVMDPGDGQSHRWSGVSGYHGSEYHAIFYVGRSGTFSGLAKTNRLDIICSADHTAMVAMVLNDGPIYTTEDSGLTWKVFGFPGHYRFRLTGDEGDGGFLVTGTILPRPQGEFEDGPGINSSMEDWYAVAAAPSGEKMVLSSLSSPTLSITKSGAAMLVSWPASFAGLVLQENTDITTANWTDVTNKVDAVDGENQVAMLPREANNFFRLRAGAQPQVGTSSGRKIALR